MLESITPLLTDPAAWAALVTLVVMEVVLGIDNLIFISILSNKLPPEHRQRTRRIGIGLALIMRLGLLATIGWIVGLTAPVFDLGWSGASFETAFSWRDLILIAGGLFLVWKATKEIHHTVDPTPSHNVLDKKDVVIANAGAAIFQIILLDLVFSVDSILTAVGMTDHVPIMMVAVIVAVLLIALAVVRLDRAALEAMPRLRLVAHLAGTVKGHLAPEVWERGIRVVNAADANALPVAEYTLAAILFANKQVFRLNRLYRERRDAPKP